MILAKAIAVLKKDALTALRYRNGFVFNMVSPALQLATFYYLARAVGPQFRPDGMPYVVFLIVGTGFYTLLIAGIHSFFQTIQQSQQAGTLEVLMTTSTPTVTLLTLSALSSFAGNFVQFVVYVGCGMLLFAPAAHISVLAGTAVLVLSLLIAAAIGLFAAGLQISIHKGSAVLWLLGSCAWLMAGPLFPVNALPRPLQVLSTLLPFTHSLTGMRLAVFEAGNSAALFREVEFLVLFSVLLLPLSVLFFSWIVRRARQSGSLSLY
jgi:ABC-type polysaccharide/polyol phosphate export permease